MRAWVVGLACLTAWVAHGRGVCAVAQAASLATPPGDPAPPAPHLALGTAMDTGRTCRAPVSEPSPSPGTWALMYALPWRVVETWSSAARPFSLSARCCDAEGCRGPHRLRQGRAAFSTGTEWSVAPALRRQASTQLRCGDMHAHSGPWPRPPHPAHYGTVSRDRLELLRAVPSHDAASARSQTHLEAWHLRLDVQVERTEGVEVTQGHQLLNLWGAQGM